MPRRVQMNGLGNKFLAGSALPLQQHRGTAGRDLGHQVENLQHGLALAHDVFKVVALLQSALELNVLFFRAMPRDRSPHIRQQLFVVPWLLNEIRRAGLHRLYRILHRAVSGDHNDRQPRILQMNLCQQVHAIAIGQRQIEQHQIEAAFSHARQSLFARSGAFARCSLRVPTRFPATRESLPHRR